MDAQRIDAFRRRLLDRRAELTALEQTRQASRETVELDQTRQGRLSRMDALQGQAMAQAAARRVGAELHRIESALARCASGDFGFCLDCDEPIAEGRLEADPAATLCVNCAAARERDR